MLPEEIDDHEVLAEWLGEKRGGKSISVFRKKDEGKIGGAGAEECGTCVVAG